MTTLQVEEIQKTVLYSLIKTLKNIIKLSLKINVKSKAFNQKLSLSKNKIVLYDIIGMHIAHCILIIDHIHVLYNVHMILSPLYQH